VKVAWRIISAGEKQARRPHAGRSASGGSSGA